MQTSSRRKKAGGSGWAFVAPALRVGLLVAVALAVGAVFGFGVIGLPGRIDPAAVQPVVAPAAGVPGDRDFAVAGRIDWEKRPDGALWPSMTLVPGEGAGVKGMVKMSIREGDGREILDEFMASARSDGWREMANASGPDRRVLERNGDIRVVIVSRIGEGLCSVADFDGTMGGRN